MPLVRLALLLIFIVLPTRGQEDEEDVYQSPETFLNETFADRPGGVPPPSLLWLSKEIRPSVRDILGHDYPALRIRYWRARTDERASACTVWILEEIGKVRPITVGLVVRNGELERLKVLIYRESHGWEVKHPFFTNQFRGASLNRNGELTPPIDGITGATLSVEALTRLGRLALTFDARVTGVDRPASP